MSGHTLYSPRSKLITSSATLGKLKELVGGWNEDTSLPKVKIACGHITDSADGEEFLWEVDTTFHHCINRLLEREKGDSFRDEPVISFEREDGRISFRALKCLFDGFRKDSAAMELLASRHKFNGPCRL